MRVLILIIALVTSQFAFAHGDHPKKAATCAAANCTQSEIELAIPTIIETLVKTSKISATWKQATVEKTEKKDFKKGAEWVATLFDKNQKETSKQRLYIFVTLSGYLNGANFTGE